MLNALRTNTSIRALLQSIDEGVVVIDKAGLPCLWNARAERVLGFQDNGPTGVWLDRPGVFARDGAPIRAADRPLAKALQGEDVDGVEVIIHVPGRSPTLVVANARPLRDETGTIVAAVGVFREVTEERRTHQELRDAEEQFRLTIDHAPIGIAVVGLDGRWLRVNHAVCEIVGYTGEELLTRTFQDITHPDDLAASLALVDQLVRGEISRYRGAKRYIRKDGSVVDTMLHVSLARSETGTPMHFISQIEDMTERKQLEAHVRLTDRMASIGTLAAGVAHEINNPLAAVASNLELLSEELRALAGDSPSGRLRELSELVFEARDGAERIRHIVRGLKSFSRADEDRRLPQDLARILDAAANLSMNEIKHRATLEKRYGASPLVDADDTRLTQVFINLLVNAAQAIPEGRAGANRVTVTTSTDAEGRAVVEVRDTGVGIAENVRARIFDPFFTTKAVGGGTGLGLSICHGIVAGLGGEITVESKLGEGTLVRVTLPPSRARVEPDAPPSSRQRSLRPHATRLRVMIVDDDPQLGRSLKRALGAQHDVVLWTSGSQALEDLLASEPYDVILCDLMMPEMSGMELHAELVTRRLDAAERMIFVTGGAFTEAGREFLDSVPNPRLEKPFDLRNLRAMVQSYRR